MLFKNIKIASFIFVFCFFWLGLSPTAFAKCGTDDKQANFPKFLPSLGDKAFVNSKNIKSGNQKILQNFLVVVPSVPYFLNYYQEQLIGAGWELDKKITNVRPIMNIRAKHAKGYKLGLLINTMMPKLCSKDASQTTLAIKLSLQKN